MSEKLKTIYFWKEGSVVSFLPSKTDNLLQLFDDRSYLGTPSYEPFQSEEEYAFGMYVKSQGRLQWSRGSKKDTPPEFLLALVVLGVLVH